MSTPIQTLVARAKFALVGKSKLGGTFELNLRNDGQVSVDANNDVAEGATPHAQCTVTFDGGLAGLTKFENATTFGRVWMLQDGEVTVDGDRNIAEKLAGFLQSA